MTTTETGRYAEDCAAAYLRASGYKVIDQNWRTRWCEIDIITQKRGITYFVEVKYRAKAAWGDGLDAITPKKLQQMAFAAELWVNERRWTGGYQLMAVSVAGQPPQVVDCIEL